MNQKTVSVQLTQQDVNALTLLVDHALKQAGIQGLDAASSLIAKVHTAVRESSENVVDMPKEGTNG